MGFLLTWATAEHNEMGGSSCSHPRTGEQQEAGPAPLQAQERGPRCSQLQAQALRSQAHQATPRARARREEGGQAGAALGVARSHSVCSSSHSGALLVTITGHPGASKDWQLLNPFLCRSNS